MYYVEEIIKPHIQFQFYYDCLPGKSHKIVRNCNFNTLGLAVIVAQQFNNVKIQDSVRFS